MFDFAQIGALAERIETFTTDLDSRLEELNNRVRTQNSLLAMLILVSGDPEKISQAERVMLDEVYEYAFGDRTRLPFAPTGYDPAQQPIPSNPLAPLYRDDGDITANADDR